nr:MAG: major capsid protein [Microviridae sp.]
MANIMNQVDVKNNAHRNGFDLSHKICFTSQSGMLLPVFSQNVLPGDSFNVSVSSFTRTQPVNTAAYTRIKEYFDWYFVPLHLIWSRAPQCIAQTNDLQFWNKPVVPYSANTLRVSSVFPQLPTSKIASLILQLKRYQEPYFGFDALHGALRLLEHLGYGFREKMGPDGKWTYDQPLDTYVNLWRLCAYQKIYNDWFRVSQWESSEPWTFNLDYFDDSDLSEWYTNFEKTFVPATKNKPTIFTMRFAPWHKDMFTGVLPSQQFGNAAAVDLNISDPSNLTLSTDGYGFIHTKGNGHLGAFSSSEIINVVKSSSSLPNDFSQLTTIPSFVPTSSTPNGSEVGISGTLKSSFTILQLRMAEAQQKWAEITQSGRLDYKSQMQKHFGVSPDDGLAHRSVYLGGTSGVLDINEVVNSNLTGDADANMAGKGVGSVQGHIKFTAKEHGILMCIYHNEPLLDYGSNVFDKQVMEVSPNDIPIPEYDSIGMDAIYMHQLTGEIPFEDSDKVLGYVPRYIHYKTCVDKVLGAFNGTLSSWVTPMSQQYVINLLYHGFQSTDWVLRLGFFHVNPALLNPIFGVDADMSVNTDQFLHNVFFDIKAARNLDRNGLPY